MPDVLCEDKPYFICNITPVCYVLCYKKMCQQRHDVGPDLYG